jgi:hypothetical protein
VDPNSHRDIAGEFPVPEAWSASTLAIAFAAVAIAAIGGVIAWRLRSRKPATATADARALEELLALERDALPSRADFGRYYERLSGIVRSYVMHRFGIAAERQTSRELLLAATAHVEFPEAERERLRGLLRLADLVKFADMTPDRAECDAHLADARAFVEATRTQPASDGDAASHPRQEVAR